jgi:N-acetylmuramoyl-L-alanine amidase
MLLPIASPPPSYAQAPDYEIKNGRFFTQTAGNAVGGYSVTDDGGVPFWTAFQQYGGVPAIGYPISRRFSWEGQPAQAFQKAVLHWRADLKRVVVVNVFDELSKAGKDQWLRDVRLVPKPAPIPGEDKLDFGHIIVRRHALLETNAAISKVYWDQDDPMTFLGLPVSPVEDYGTVVVVRLQRAVLQQWKTDRPWAKAGDVVLANGGDVAKEAGLFPAAAVAIEPPGGAPPGPLPVAEGSAPAPAITPFASNALSTSTPRSQPAAANTPVPAARNADSAGGAAIPTAAPPPAQPAGGYVIAVDPGHGGPDQGSVVKLSDGFVLREKDVNLTVAKKLTQLLREAGFAVVLTRDSDAAVNAARRDLNGDGIADMRDELQARVDIANTAKAHLFLSIHHNGHERTDLNGLEMYSCRNRPFADQNRRLAALAEDSMLKSIRAAGYPLATRGQKDCYDKTVEKSYFVIGPIDLAAGRPRATNMPGIIGEPLFVTSPLDGPQLRNDAILTAEARGYLDAVKRYFAK